MTKKFRMPQGLADDLRFIQLLNSGEILYSVRTLQKEKPTMCIGNTNSRGNWGFIEKRHFLSQVQKQNRLNPRAHLGLSLFFCMAQQHLFHSNQEKFDGVLQPM